LDSLQNLGAAYLGSSSCGYLQYDSIQFGRLMWTGISQRTLPTDSNKVQSVMLLYCENYCVKKESQFNISQIKEDTCFIEHYYGSQCDSMWTEVIDLQTNNNNEIVINTSIDVIVEIYKASLYSIDPPIMKFLAVGTSSNQNFQVNLENNVSYIVIFRDSEDFIVNIKKIGGL